MSSVVVDAVEHLVRGIVDNPDDVRVDMVTSRRGRTVEVHVHPEDLGKVIGRGGRTATALRTLVAGIGGRGIRVDVVDTDQIVNMDLVVGRVVKAHGVTGEVVVDVRTDDPETRFAPGTSLRARAKGGAERRSSSTPRARTAGGCWSGSTGLPTATAPMRYAARCFSSIRRICHPSRTPTSSTTISSKGCRFARPRENRSARSPRYCTPRRRTALGANRQTARCSSRSSAPS